MKFAVILKTKIENLFSRFPRVSGYIARLVFALAALLLLRANCGYNLTLTNIWVVIVLGIFCAFAPLRILSLILVIYAMVQLFSFSMGTGGVCALILLAVYLIFFRFDREYLYLMLLIPLLSMCRLTLLIPLIVAAVGSVQTLAVVLFGYLLYFMIRYVNLNAAIISGITGTDSFMGTEMAKMSHVIKGIFTDREFIYMLVILTAVFLLVYNLRRIRINQANYIAVAAGSGAYVIFYIIANLIFDTLTKQRLLTCVVCALVSGFLAAVIIYALLPLDYTRTENFEFEDDDYHYYVRAVPKAVIKKESVKIKKINTRKETNLDKRGREDSR